MAAAKATRARRFMARPASVRRRISRPNCSRPGRRGLRHVPFRGAAPMVTELIAGRIDVSFSTLPSVIAQIEAGRFQTLAIASAARAERLSKVPTLRTWHRGRRGRRLVRAVRAGEAPRLDRKGSTARSPRRSTPTARVGVCRTGHDAELRSPATSPPGCRARCEMGGGDQSRPASSSSRGSRADCMKRRDFITGARGAAAIGRCRPARNRRTDTGDRPALQRHPNRAGAAASTRSSEGSRARRLGRRQATSSDRISLRRRSFRSAAAMAADLVNRKSRPSSRSRARPRRKRPRPRPRPFRWCSRSAATR